MTALPARNVLDGTKTPRTQTHEFQDAIGDFRDFVAEALGTDSEDKEAMRAALGALAKAGDSMIGALNEAAAVSVASAITTDIGAAASNNVTVTGTTTITGLGTIAAGAKRTVTFSGALTLTHNATSLILPGGANITTAAGDVAVFVSLGSGNWRCASYTKASGRAVVGDLSASDKAKLDGIATEATAINLGTTSAAASGTAIDLTGISASAKRVIIKARFCSTNGSSGWLLQLGSGSVVTSNYSSTGALIADGNTTLVTTSTTGILVVHSTGAAAVISGTVVLERFSSDSNIWEVTGKLRRTDSAQILESSGGISLSGALDRVRWTTVNGTDQFDGSGVISLTWE